MLAVWIRRRSFANTVSIDTLCNILQVIIYCLALMFLVVYRQQYPMKNWLDVGCTGMKTVVCEFSKYWDALFCTVAYNSFSSSGGFSSLYPCLKCLYGRGLGRELLPTLTGIQVKALIPTKNV